MILDHIDNANRYACLNPRFATAFAMLRRSNIELLPEGRMEIDGDNLYAMIIKEPGRKPEEAMLETHDKYIDVQYVISGTDTMGWKTRKRLGKASDASKPENDVLFYDDEPDAWTEVTPGMFAIYFPEDAHMPMISENILHKIVVKVAV